MKRVLSVGQCVPDNNSLKNYLDANFDVIFDRAATLQETLSQMETNTYDLVLINRKLDIDYTDGLEILRHIKNDPNLGSTKVMMVTNLDEHKKIAVQEGGDGAFGKAEYAKPETLEILKPVLST